AGALRFDWTKPVAAAVWRRGDRIWVLFDAPSQIDLAEVRQNGRAAVPAIEQVENARATVLRLETIAGFSPLLSRQGNSWTVELRPQPQRPEASITVTAQPAAQPPRVVFALREPGAAITVPDPE